MMEIGKTRVVVPERIEKGQVIRVHVVVQHPMDTGFFRDANAVLIPPYFIKDVVVRYGEEEIATFEWTSGISKDPMIAFLLKAEKEAPLTFVWRDNKGGEYSGSTEIKFTAA
ncbi:MAG TPA: thiosulfate oxidation carrier complex protein SoxZ [Gemmatimonadales bacterium]|nr:thiosulfate oxidation carrier complex protein SoxZ [Gemmatimonadales bacterium]